MIPCSWLLAHCNQLLDYCVLCADDIHNSITVIIIMSDCRVQSAECRVQSAEIVKLLHWYRWYILYIGL